MPATSQTIFNSGKLDISGAVQIPGDPMAISHELSSEIATALFSRKQRSPRELRDLKDVIFEIHSTLEQLTREAHAAHAARLDRSTLRSMSARNAKDI